MLYLINSEPHFSNPSEIDHAKVEFVNWLKNLKAEKKLVSAYQKIGKGSIVIFDVSSNDELNELMSKWLKIASVPITYEVMPLPSPIEI